MAIHEVVHTLEVGAGPSSLRKDCSYHFPHRGIVEAERRGLLEVSLRGGALWMQLVLGPDGGPPRRPPPRPTARREDMRSPSRGRDGTAQARGDGTVAPYPDPPLRQPPPRPPARRDDARSPSRGREGAAPARVDGAVAPHPELLLWDGATPLTRDPLRSAAGTPRTTPRPPGTRRGGMISQPSSPFQTF